MSVDLIDIRKLSVIGVLGPSVDYTSTGTDLRKALRLLYRGETQGVTILHGFDLLFSRLASHTRDWKELPQPDYQKRQPLPPRTIQRPATPVRTRRGPPQRHPIKPRRGIRSVREHKPIGTARKDANSLSPQTESASSTELHVDSPDTPSANGALGTYQSLTSKLK